MPDMSGFGGGQSITTYTITQFRVSQHGANNRDLRMCFAPKHRQVLGAQHVSNPE